MPDQLRPGPPDYVGLSKSQIFMAWHSEPMLWREIYTRAVATLIAAAGVAVGASAGGVITVGAVAVGIVVGLSVAVPLLTGLFIAEIALALKRRNRRRALRLVARLSVIIVGYAAVIGAVLLVS